MTSPQTHHDLRRVVSAWLSDISLLGPKIPVLSVMLKSKDQVPRCLDHLFEGLKRIQAGEETIPRDVAPWIRGALGPRDPAIQASWLVDKDRYPVQDERLLPGEFEQLRRIAEITQECTLELAPEVVWNEDVHSRLLDIALAPYRTTLRHRNITTVDISPEYLLPVADTGPAMSLAQSLECGGSTVGSIMSQTTMTLQTKRVDYAIILNDSELKNEAMKLLRKQVRDQAGTVVQSINHVEDNGFLRCRPIAVSIETKTPDGGESVGRTQLSIWGAAHLMRLQAAAEPVTCSAAGTPAPGRSRNALTTALPNTEISSTTTDDNLGLPLVLVVGSKWTVYFLVDHGEYLEFFEALPSIADTATIDGCYRAIALIRELAEWSTKVYRPWFRRVVLGVAA